jgi:TonB family protein
MDNLIWYFLEVNVLTLVLTLIYFFIRNQLNFTQRRVAILFIPILSISVLLYKLSGTAETNAVYNLPVFEISSPQTNYESTIEPNSILNLQTLTTIYWLGAFVMLVFFIYKFYRIWSMLKKTKVGQVDSIIISNIQDQPCFSFFNYIQLQPSIPENEREVIFQHEKIHIEKKHSYDILYISAIQISCWFNPAISALKKELTEVHEYQVDQVMYGRHQTEYMQFLLDYSLGTSSTPYLLTNQFYSKKTLIKRMIFMKTKTKNRWAFGLIIPVVATSFALVSWTMNEKRIPTSATSTHIDTTIGEVEKMPEYQGGMEALSNYLSTNIQYPETAKNNKIEGKVIISFMVEATGKVSKCVVKESAHADLDNEALRVVSSMPDWIPGEKDGKKVGVEMTLPIVFKL